MMSRPGHLSAQPAIPSLPLRDLEVERGFDLLFLSSPFPVGSTRWVDPREGLIGEVLPVCGW